MELMLDSPHARTHRLLLKSTLADLRMQAASITALSPLLPTSFLASLSDAEQARAYRYILMTWAITDQ